MVKIAYDSDVSDFGIARSIVSLEKIFQDSLDSPPRIHAEVNNGSIVFTVGGSRLSNRAGFRVYTTFPNDNQITVVYDSESGGIEGIVFGSLLGAYRTAAIGALSIKYMSNTDADSLGVVGSGVQAFHQAVAALHVRNFSRIIAFSRSPEHLASFASRLGNVVGIPIIRSASPADVVSRSDVIITATRSDFPLFDAAILRKGSHVVSVGSKTVGNSELDPSIARMVTFAATDSVVQLENYTPPHIMAGRPVTGLGDIIRGKVEARESRDDITIFLSVGLSGTEVMLASEILKRK